MIDIKSISGESLFNVPITKDAVSHQELMVADYIALSWSSDNGAILPAGAYIEYEGERYSILEPYTPNRVNELEYDYKPKFYSRIAIWDRQPACVYTYQEDGVTLKTREFDWSFVGSPADAIHIVLQSIRNEVGEEWTARIADSLPATVELSSQTASIQSVLSSIADQCETEYWVDMKNNILHLSRCEIGDVVELSVGSNVKVPSTTSSNEGYYTRFYPLGSTKNVTQNAQTTLNGVVNKRLMLDPIKYPFGYKDVKGSFVDGVFESSLSEGEIFSKVVTFDDIYPSSNLVISDVRPRLKYRLNGADKVVVGGTDDEPVYEQYAIWYFRIDGFNFNKDSIIKGTELSVHFKTNQLAGRDFKLQYHEKGGLESASDDVAPFVVNDGDYEILFEEQNGVIIPSTAYIIPQDGDEIVLYNIEMPQEYVAAAQIRLEEAIDKYIAEQERDKNTYEFDSDAVAFYEDGIDLSLGQSVRYTNGDKSIDTRVLMVEKHLDFSCEQRIRVGNEIIKGRTQELRDEVNSLNQNVDVLAAFNDMSKTIQDSYVRTQAKVSEALAAYGEMFYWREKGVTIGTRYNLYSEGEISAGGEGEAIGTGGEGGLDEETLQRYLDENGYATQEWVDDQGYASEQSVTTLGTKVSNLGDRVTNLEAGGGTGGGDIDLTAYATKEWVEDKGYATLSAVSTALLKKQDKITNLATIESGAAKGATAVQPESLAKVATSGSYNDLSDKPTIPAAVTETTVAGWGFTKNTGNYTKPTAGIPKSDLASAVQQSLGKADTALQTIPDEYITEDELAKAIANKVDKDGDKVLSDNNYTDEDKAKLDGLSNYDDTALTQRITAAEGEIRNIKKDVSDNSDSIGDVDSRLQTIEAWHNTIGQKFSLDKDAVKLSGDFFTTGENSAAGKGEAIGGEGGGGIDYDELEDYLADKHYATESWVNQQGFAKGTIPTRVSQLTNDAQYLASITSDMVTAALGYNPFNSANFTKGNIKSTLGISDWALASTKPSYDYGEIDGTPDLSAYAKASDLNGKVDKVSGKGLSTNDYTDTEKAKLASLQNYDDSALTQRVTNVESKANTNASAIESLEERASNHENAISGIASRLATIEGWRTEWDKHISYDTQKKAVKVTGDFYATGESSASGMGEEIGDIEQLLTRLTTAEDTIAQQKAQLIALGTALGALQSELEELRNQINK